MRNFDIFAIALLFISFCVSASAVQPSYPEKNHAKPVVCSKCGVEYHPWVGHICIPK